MYYMIVNMDYSKEENISLYMGGSERGLNELLSKEGQIEERHFSGFKALKIIPKFQRLH